jgi:hypothetical protein
MNAAVLSVLDRSLQYSLWGVLLVFLALLLFLSYQMRSRKLSVGELYEEESAKWPRRRRISTNAQIRVAARALAVSLLAGPFLFAAFTFVPLPGIDNFASGTAWQIPPLRVTALNYERFHEGFTLKGELWNQSETELVGITAVVRVWGTDDKLLDELPTKITPDPLAAGSPATFEVEYRQNSPFIQGYQLSFLDQTGTSLPHVAGFDVQ